MPRRKRVRRRPWNYNMRMELCMNCDGCGWVEGGACLKTTCHVCSGRGKLFPYDKKVRAGK